MKKKASPALIDHLAVLEDPRIERQKRHKLGDILVIAVCAVLCGAESFPAIEDFGQVRYTWLKQFLELPNGIPSHDTFNRVFRVLDPVQFQACFLSWMQAVADETQGEVVAIDGKTLRRSFDRSSAKRAIHMVSAWATENGVVLGQRKVDDKSNEITAIPELLELLALKGCIVTIDAMAVSGPLPSRLSRIKRTMSWRSRRISRRCTRPSSSSWPQGQRRTRIARSVSTMTNMNTAMDEQRAAAIGARTTSRS